MTAFRAAQGTELRLQLIVNNQPVAAAEGDTVAAALLGSGRWTFRRDHAGAAHGPFCLMGVCQECLVEIDGVPNRRACLVPVAQGMKVNCG
jgi:D-hydroxyproline dehydrogenase subunit gamma